MKRAILFFLTLVMMFRLIGCAQETDPAEPEITGKIVLMSSQNWLDDTDREYAKKFTGETGIEVDVQGVPDDQYLNIVMSKLASGSGPDLFWSNSGTAIYDYMPEAYMLDLSDEPWVDNMEDWAKDATTFNGKTVGMSLWSVSGWGLMYNTQIFKEYGLEEPTTFEELKAVCKVLKDNGIRPFFDCSADNWHDSVWLSTLSGAAQVADPDVIDKLNNDEIKFADVPVLEQALTQLNELHELGYLGDTHISDTWNMGYDAMGTGKAAMILTYPNYQNEMVANYPDIHAEEWTECVNPLVDNKVWAHESGGYFIAVNKDSKNIDAAKMFLEFLARPENTQGYYDGNAERRSNSAFKGIEVVSNAANQRMFNDYDSYIDLQSGVKYFNDVIISKLIQEMFIGTRTPMQVLEGIDEYRAGMFEME